LAFSKRGFFCRDCGMPHDDWCGVRA